MHKAMELCQKNIEQPEQLPGLTLAYIGDAVYELYVRTMLLEESVNAHTLNKFGVKFVNNRTQSALYAMIESDLTEVEAGVLRRGRNGKGIVPKNANTQDYRRATAIEAIIGYWYLIDDEKRLQWVFDKLKELQKGE